MIDSFWKFSTNFYIFPEMLRKTDGAASLWRQVAISVGYSCNNDCCFCVAADKRLFRDRTTKEIRQGLKDSYADGVRNVVFSGGECSIRKDIVELVSFAKRVGFQRISVQTNGRAFASREFCRRMILAGLTGFLPSLHGHVAELHDSLTRRNGSFRQTILGIYNIRSLSRGMIAVATNTVVIKQNYRYLPKIAKLLVGLGVSQVQFAFVHAQGNAGSSFKEIVPLKSAVVPYIMRGIDLVVRAGRGAWVEAVPPCCLKGYEEHVSDRAIPSTELKELGRTIPRFEEVRVNQAKVKFLQCRRCMYDAVCEGPWREYPEYYGNEEFRPVEPGQ